MSSVFCRPDPLLVLHERHLGVVQDVGLAEPGAQPVSAPAQDLRQLGVVRGNLQHWQNGGQHRP